ncbi:MAG: NADH-quinone oxidoreductase subunit C, partial [Anaplasmataceae bacterium]|nr:NADH-quinone oxidoreductase subunit C [Anaplasmataceae bacterium]
MSIHFLNDESFQRFNLKSDSNLILDQHCIKKSYCIDISDLLSIFLVLKNKQFMLIDLFAIDYLLYDRKRFAILYVMRSLYNNSEIIFKVEISDKEEMYSLCGIFLCAEWFEREVFDMYGIIFLNHPRLERLLMEEDFN